VELYGLSQSSGAERLLGVARDGEGVELRATDPDRGDPLGRVAVSAARLGAALAGRAAGGVLLEGVCPDTGTPGQLLVEVRGNEVLLCARPDSGDGWDVAVGLDDLLDAVGEAGDAG
jgi:hypothetical protein